MSPANSASQVGPLLLLSEWAISMGAFRRNRVPLGSKVVAAALCNAGYSYREVAELVGDMSYIAARDSFQALVTTLPMEERAYRRAVAIDGADVRAGSGTFHLWLARDADSGRILQFHASPTGSGFDGGRFLASVAAQCTNRPYVRLGTGPNYPRGLLNLDLYFQNTPTLSLIGRLGRLLTGGL